MQGVNISGQELVRAPGQTGGMPKVHAANVEGVFSVRTLGGWQFEKFSAADQAWVDARSKTVDGKRVWK